MATIYDVARHAGVSHTAVSAVLNGKRDQVGAETWQRILNAIEELGYKPNRVARQLATGRTNTIAVCFKQPFKEVFLTPLNSHLIAGIAQSLSESGYYLLIAPTAPKYHFEQVVNGLPSHGVDGAIVVGGIPLNDTMIEAIDGCSIPIVCVDSYPGFTKATTVDIDNAGSAKKGVAHLISHNHRNLVYIGPTPDCQAHMDRMRGFWEALEEHDIPVNEDSIRLVSDRQVKVVLLEMLGSENPPTAIVCGRWDHCIAVCDTIDSLGLRIPTDISILTFDSPAHEQTIPEMVNKIRPIAYEMGVTAADTLKKILGGEFKFPQNIRLSAEMTFHPSSAPGFNEVLLAP